MGLGPHTLSEQDKVVLFSGGNVPFVVRGDPGGDFKFIGECYVHGIMDGEVVPSDEEAWPPYEFHIVWVKSRRSLLLRHTRDHHTHTREEAWESWLSKI